ncbi:hypothetical protein [Clostridium cagae]|uniref:hypothetical protein n=1 Tax=Clostridium cagae TaxID=2080751 RepID=UPI000CF6F133|nr:hypothetical protein [Clostridium cagae]
MRNKKRIIMFFIFIAFLFLTFCPMKIPVSPKGNFNKNRLIVGLGGDMPCTGALYSIIKGNEDVEEYFHNDKHVNTNRVTLIGDTPLDNIDIDALTTELQFIVNGKIVSIEEESPVFYVDSYESISYITYFCYGKSMIFYLIWLVLLLLLVIESIVWTYKKCLCL